MKLLTIKKVVVAALLLPTVVMAFEGFMLIRYYHRDLTNLESSQQHANLLTIAGEIASAAAPEEGGATLAYIAGQDVDTLATMRGARQRLDQQIDRLHGLINNRTYDESNVVEKLAALQRRYEAVQRFRSKVDSGLARSTEVISAYQPVSRGYLDLVEALDQHISDPRLLRKLSELRIMLDANEAGLLIAFIGSEYLADGHMTPQRQARLGSAFSRYENYVNEVRGHPDGEAHAGVLSFHGSSSGLVFREATLKILQRDRMVLGYEIPSVEAKKAWDDLHFGRIDLWKRDLKMMISDIRALGEMLAAQSRLHFAALAAAVSLLSLIAGITVLLAAKGVHLVDRLSREREALVGELRNAAETDMLTGFHNRRGFDEAVQSLATAPNGSRRTHCLVIFDLDRFKLVNDIHGHDSGDVVLAEVARVARTAFRPVDLLARHGGEEFVALIPDCGLPEAAVVAERVRRAIAEADVILPSGEKIRVTASFGCASHEGDFAPGKIADMVKKADLALYAAKFAGRDRVVCDGQCDKVSPEWREAKLA